MNDNVSRRIFLGAAAALAAGPMIAGAAGLPRAVRRRQPEVNSKVTLGFIGMGIMNRDHLGRFLGDERVRVLAVCDVDTTRREHARKMVDDRYGSEGYCGAYNDHRQLLARQDIDAVVIGTPDHWHAIQVIEACQAGKDIYCEKPLSLTIHEARAMIDAVRKYNRVFQTGSQQRTEFEGRFRRAVEYARSGRLGKILTIHVGVGPSSIWCDLAEEPMEPGLDWDRWLGPAPVRPYNSILSPRGINDFYPNWRRYREYSGGTLTDMGAHHFDIAQWALDADGGGGGPIDVYPPRDPKAQHGARLVFANGVEVIHGGPSGVTIVGTNGVLQVDRGRLSSVPESIINDPLKDDELHLPTWPDHHAAWLDCVASRARPNCDVEIGARTITCAHLVNLAYWHRRDLKWDTVRWEFIGDREANGWRDYERRKGFELPKV